MSGLGPSLALSACMHMHETKDEKLAEQDLSSPLAQHTHTRILEDQCPKPVVIAEGGITSILAAIGHPAILVDLT